MAAWAEINESSLRVAACDPTERYLETLSDVVEHPTFLVRRERNSIEGMLHRRSLSPTGSF
jgi:hypothetical protein